MVQFAKTLTSIAGYKVKCEIIPYSTDSPILLSRSNCCLDFLGIFLTCPAYTIAFNFPLYESL